MTERDRVMTALRVASTRFVALVESLEPGDAATPVVGLDWNVGETVAHVLTVVRRGFADLRRSATPEATADLNEVCLDETPERDPRVLAAMLRSDIPVALDVVFPKIPDDREIPFHGGVTTTMVPALRVVLGEFLIHGHDVATATGKAWTIEPGEAALLVPGELLGAWVRPDAPEGVYEIRLTGLPPLRSALGPRRFVPTGAEPDVVIDADPVEFVLAFYGRVGTADPGIERLRSRFVPA